MDVITAAGLNAGFKRTADGGVILREPSAPGAQDGLVVRGYFSEWVNGEFMGEHQNLVVDQGMIDILNTYFGSTAKKAGFYVSLFAGAVNPAAGWTAASYPATASEITSGSEGYSQSTRPQYVVVNASSSTQIDNYAAKAAFTIVTASTLTVNGAAIVTESTKGSTSGVLVAASRYGTARTLQNGDAYEVGYRFVAASS